MAKKLVVLVLAIFAGACAMRQTMPNGITENVLAPQVGVNVQVIDLCGGEPGMLYGTHGYAVNGLRTLPGRDFWVAMPSDDGTKTNSISLTYIAMSGGRPKVSVSRSFPVSYYQGSRRFQWVLVRNRGRSGGGHNVYIDLCP